MNMGYRFKISPNSRKILIAWGYERGVLSAKEPNESGKEIGRNWGGKAGRTRQTCRVLDIVRLGTGTLLYAFPCIQREMKR
jgi:hypothetical protein